MPLLRTATAVIETLPGETVLDALLRRGVAHPFSCRGGSCRSCLQRATAGQPGERAQRNLAPELAALGYFLPCVCVPETDLALAPPDPAHFWIDALLAAKAPLADGRCKLQFEPLSALACPVGTPIRLRNADGLDGRARAASDPAQDFYLELVLDRADDFGRWAIDVLAEGESVQLQALPGGDGRAADAGASDAAADAAPAQPQPPHGHPAHSASAAPRHPEPAPPPPDPALWAALDGGRVVRAVLEDFYDRVYADALLAPFFHKFTRQRLVEKQYSFLHELITGERVYFGNRPRNSHHWMVISDELFDHREALMLAVLREHGLSEALVQRWHAIENHYRGEIVKPAAWPKKVGEFEAPLDGFGELLMEVGSVCDGCGGEVAAGETVRYHLREGTVFCARCGEGGALKAA
ncbi:2Fe-2S iron-sulfur cluster-binding protein [Derxia lacustris]|uniref:2Fe-2S iron-sulfur cluster-binding protein n=1 Tax=Derxia lacustris TaxID=764842 RepID=UPI001F2ADD33|nr:2Fe-2S iron-sulfur cluster-binding protein [Derxia lacustris]